MSADAARRPEDAPAGIPSPGDAAGLISHLSHSLRTPLNSILGYAQILMLDRSEPLSPVQRERVERIQEAGWQLVKLIDDMARQAAGEPSDAQGSAARGADETPPGSAA